MIFVTLVTFFPKYRHLFARGLATRDFGGMVGGCKRHGLTTTKRPWTGCKLSGTRRTPCRRLSEKPQF